MAASDFAMIRLKDDLISAAHLGVITVKIK